MDCRVILYQKIGSNYWLVLDYFLYFAKLTLNPFRPCCSGMFLFCGCCLLYLQQYLLPVIDISTYQITYNRTRGIMLVYPKIFYKLLVIIITTTETRTLLSFHMSSVTTKNNFLSEYKHTRTQRNDAKNAKKILLRPSRLKSIKINSNMLQLILVFDPNVPPLP